MSAIAARLADGRLHLQQGPIDLIVEALGAADEVERAYGQATVMADGEKLTMKWGKFTYRLDHYHFDTFTAVPVEPRDELVSSDRGSIDVQFRLAANGSVEGLKFLDQEFKREKEAKK